MLKFEAAASVRVSQRSQASSSLANEMRILPPTRQFVASGHGFGNQRAVAELAGNGVRFERLDVPLLSRPLSRPRPPHKWLKAFGLQRSIADLDERRLMQAERFVVAILDVSDRTRGARFQRTCFTGIEAR